MLFKCALHVNGAFQSLQWESRGWSVHTRKRAGDLCCGLWRRSCSHQRPTLSVSVSWPQLHVFHWSSWCKNSWNSPALSYNMLSTSTSLPSPLAPCPSQPSWYGLLPCAPLLQVSMSSLWRKVWDLAPRAEGNCSQLFTGWNHRLDSDEASFLGSSETWKIINSDSLAVAGELFTLDWGPG